MLRFFKTFMYRRKYKRHLTLFPKLVSVVVSCNTAEQCAMAMTYVALYKRRFVKEDDWGVITAMLLNQLLSFLQDTAEHAEKGYHKPEVYKYKTVARYPDINDYLGGVIPLKFRKSWVRGTPTIIFE